MRMTVCLGTIESVDGTMFDLRADTILGPRLPQVPGGIGYNTNYALCRSGWDKHAARFVFELSPKSNLFQCSVE